MKDRKNSFVPKKKAIRKPRFIVYLAIWLAVFLTIGMTVSYFILDVCRREARNKALSKWNTYTQEVSKYVNDYCSAPEDEREVYFNRLREFVYQYGYDMDEYCAVYVDFDKILETPRGPSAIIGVEIEQEDYEDEPRYEYYTLEDWSYVYELVKSYGYDIEKNARLKAEYSMESDVSAGFARKAGLIPEFFDVDWESVYINEEKHTFIPGKINVYEYEIFEDEDGYKGRGDIIKTIERTPDNAWEYRMLDITEFDSLYDGCIDPALTDIREAWSINSEPEIDMLFSETASLFTWECLTTSAEAYCNKECFKVLPATTPLVLTIAGVVSVLLAVTVSSIIYSSKKAVWEIFEYRKKTTAAMAHDLKTPLAAVSAYAESLEYDIDPDKRSYYSSKVRENAAFMNKTIESILLFTKSETDTGRSKVSDIDVHALIEEEYDAVAELFNKKNIKADIKGEGHVRSSKELLDQAVRNLIGNAAKYARPGTTLDIEIDGKGFRMTNLTDQKITNVKDLKKPFVKGDESRGTESGAGLGLSIAENCLLSAGHSLEIAFEDERFTVTVRW